MERLTTSLPLEDYGPFFGGLFEVGGGMGWEHQHKKVRFGSKVCEYNYHYPLLSFNSEDPERVQIVYSLLGGKDPKKHNNNSWNWRLRNGPVLDLAEQMQQYAPSRAKHLEAYFKWEEAGDVAEKALIVAENPLLYSGFPITPRTYSGLVQDPIFMAGVLLGRGSVRKDTGGLRIGSLNQALLQAIKDHYSPGSGTVFPAGRTEEGEKGWVPGQIPHKLEVGRQVREHLIYQVAGYIDLPVAA